jgi:predicted Rdx family selenoprotein
MNKAQTIALIDRTSRDFVLLMGDTDIFNRHQIEMHALLGNFKATAIGCGCIRPSSCGSCRTIVEDEIHWQEKMEDLLDEARREAQDERDYNDTDIDEY